MNSSVKQAHIQQAQAVCRKYCGQVRRSLFCPAALREPILSQLEEAVLFYLEEHPQAGMDELYAHFGEPKAFAANVLENMEGEQRLLQLRLMSDDSLFNGLLTPHEVNTNMTKKANKIPFLFS